MSSLEKLHILVKECRNASRKLHKRVVWTDEVKKEVARLIQCGLSCSKLYHTFGFGYPSLKKWINEYSPNIEERQREIETDAMEAQFGFKCLVVDPCESTFEHIEKEEIPEEKEAQENTRDISLKMNSNLRNDELTNCYYSIFRVFLPNGIGLEIPIGHDADFFNRLSFFANWKGDTHV